MTRIVLLVTATFLSGFALVAAAGTQGASPATLKSMFDEYYKWRNENYPVASSDQGLHTWDNRLTDYSAAAIASRSAHIKDLLSRVRAIDTRGWPKEDRIDWLLFRSQLDAAEFGDRVLNFTETNPQLYVDECSNGIFSLLKKEYDSPANRARAATSRLTQMPALMELARDNLKHPVSLYARLAIDSARSIDPLLNQSLMSLTTSLDTRELNDLTAARDSALKAIHDFAGWLEQRLPSMAEFKPMGIDNYNYMLRHLYLLPLDADQVAMLGEAELARYRALEAMLPDPKLAEPDPKRSPHIPETQAEFLNAYERRETEMIQFLKDRRLVTLPRYLGPFQIRQLPDAFKPTNPGGFMNPPGLYDRDDSGFYFIPAYDPRSRNFYIRAAIEDPRPILGHEGIPGHFLQLSIANHLTNQVRREQGDGVFVEGWALYTEEMLTRTGLYPEGSAARGQVLRLSRYRAARIGVDVNLHTGRWSFDQAVRYFMDAGGLDREAAEGEAAGAASSPTQKITYMVGKWQIMRLLGRYRDRKADAFNLGEFHDDLLKYGSLPLSVVEWLLLDDPSTLEHALNRQ